MNPKKINFNVALFIGDFVIEGIYYPGSRAGLSSIDPSVEPDFTIETIYQVKPTGLVKVNNSLEKYILNNHADKIIELAFEHIEAEKSIRAERKEVQDENNKS